MNERHKTIDWPVTGPDAAVLNEALAAYKSLSMQEPGDYPWSEYHAHLEADLASLRSRFEVE